MRTIDRQTHRSRLKSSGRRPLLVILIAFGFFLGQYAALVHATHHELVSQPDQPACAICAIAHAAGVRPAMPPLPSAAPVHAAPPVPRIARLARYQFVTLPPARAPPLIPA